MNQIIKTLLLRNIKIDEYSPQYRKTIFVNFILIATALGLLTFSILNYFVFFEYKIATFELISFLITNYALYDIRVNKNIKIASLIASFNLSIFLLILIYLREGSYFTLIWTIFIPITLISVNGSKKGFYYSVIFYFIVLSYTYTGIGTWQDGAWDTASYARFFGASVLLVFVTYFTEQGFEKSHAVLVQTRKREKEYVGKLQICSITDPLTELYNRRHLEQIFDENFEKADFNKSCFGFFILDLDDFKLYNDTYGHIKGDEALKKVANKLKENMQREVDKVFRLGGEEFCGLVIANSSEKIFKSIQNIQKEIQNINIEHKSSTHKVITVSIGVCIIDNFEVKNFDKMYQIADDYMYKAKENGKNCTVGSTHPLHLTVLKDEEKK